MILSINHVNFSYGRKRPPVLTDFTMDLEQGGIYGLLGPNGAGKSTLLYLIAGLLTPGSGQVSFDGFDTRRRLPHVLADIFLVPEEVTLPRMNLEKFISLNAPFYPNFNRDTLDRCLDRFGISEPQRIDSLSMGQKKKLFLSFALACRTRVLLLDEPTNGLDIPGKASFRSLVAEEITDERIIIISTHQVRDLDKLLDKVIIMDAHRLILNQGIANVQAHLRFAEGIYPCPENALHAIPTPGGFDAMFLNEEGVDTEVNLELLFDFALHKRDLLSEIFKTDTKA